MVHLVEVMGEIHEKMHLMHFGIEFGIELGLPQKEDSLVEGDRVVGLGVV